MGQHKFYALEIAFLPMSVGTGGPLSGVKFADEMARDGRGAFRPEHHEVETMVAPSLNVYANPYSVREEEIGEYMSSKRSVWCMDFFEGYRSLQVMKVWSTNEIAMGVRDGNFSYAIDYSQARFYQALMNHMCDIAAFANSALYRSPELTKAIRRELTLLNGLFGAGRREFSSFQTVNTSLMQSAVPVVREEEKVDV